MFAPRLGVSLNFVERQQVSAEGLAAIARSSIATIEVPSAFLANDDWLRMVRQTIVDTGKAVTGVHVAFGTQLDLSSLDSAVHGNAAEEAGRSLWWARRLGAGLVVLHASAEPIADEERPLRMERCRRGLQEIGAVAAECGCRVALELLPRTCLGNTVDELFALTEELDPAVFGVCLDVNHLMARHGELPRVVQRLGQRLLNLHLSDYDGVDEKHWLPGKGAIDWKAFMRALADIDYQGAFNYEADPQVEGVEARVKAFEENFAWLSRLR